MSTRSVQLERSERAFACFWVANRAAKSTRYLCFLSFVGMCSIQLSYGRTRKPAGLRSEAADPVIWFIVHRRRASVNQAAT